MKQVTSRDITPLSRSSGPVFYRRVGLVAWYVVHVLKDAAGSLPFAVHVWDATVFLVVPPPHAQQALPKHATLMGVVVSLTTPMAIQVLLWIRPSPIISERRQGLVSLLRREPFPFSVGVAHPRGEVDVGVCLHEMYHAVVHHPAVVVVLLLE
jgi:hypothetical protein